MTVGAEGEKTSPTTVSTTLMLGQWAQRAFWHSWDGKTLLVTKFDALQVVREGETKEYKLSPITDRYCMWSPDSRKFLFAGEKGLAMADIGRLGQPGGPMAHKIVYEPPPGKQNMGCCWTPTGDSFFVNERGKDEEGKPYSELKKFPLEGGAGKVIVRHGPIAFFLPPSSRFEDGSGPSSRPYHIVFGARDGIHIVDQGGEKVEKILPVAVEAAGVVEDVIWSPGAKDKLVFFFRRPQPLQGGGILKGLQLYHVDKKGKPDALEELYPGQDLHTVWFSFHGKYLVWATHDAAYYREVDGKAGSTVKIELEKDRPLVVKGAAMNHKENRIAITASNRLYLHDVTTKKTTLHATVGDNDKSFIAQPFWTRDKDEVTFSVFTDVGIPLKKKK